jgi:RND family efflux transporter MFP subunit
MKRKLPVVLAGIAILLISGCQHSAEQTALANEAIPKNVVVAVARRSLAFRRIEQMGTVVARKHAGIETRVQAQVQRIPVALGTRVEKGDLLLELDTRELHARVQQARAVLDQAAPDFARFERLREQGAVTQQDFEAIRTRKTVAEAGLSEAEVMLSYTRITAPFSGTIANKTVNVGDLAIPGRPLLTLDDDAARQMVVGIPETHRNRINLGDTLPVILSAADTSVPGIVEEISSSADPASRTFLVKVRLSDRADVRPGQLGWLLIPTTEEPSVSIPLSALVRRGQLELVYVAATDNRANLRLVRAGRQYQGEIEILAGLNEGERVVVSPQAGLSDGDVVEGRQ